MVNIIRWIGLVIGLAVLIGCITITSGNLLTVLINSPSIGDTVYTDTIKVSGLAASTVGGPVVSVTVNGVSASGNPGLTNWSAVIPLQPGLNTINVIATDVFDNNGTETITVYYDEQTSTQTGGQSAPAPTPSPTPTPTVTPTGSISITTVPLGAEVCLDGSRTCITPCSFDLVSAGSYTINITKEGYINVTKAISLGPGETLNLDNINLEPLTGCINVSSLPPGASVYLDGARKGETPLLICDVDVGLHSIKLTKSCYRDITETLSIYAGETPYGRNLTGYGSLEISSDPPGASVYLNGKYGGITSCLIRDVKEGSHNITLNKSGYDDVTIPVSVSTCETTPRHVVLTGYGSLYISSDPSGASVYLDGEYVGETPCTSGEIKEGSHFITLTKYRYKNVTKMTQVSAGITTPVSIDLSYVLWIYGIIFGIISTVGVVAFIWLRKTGRVPKWVIEGKVPWWAVVILVAAALTQIIKSLLSLL